MNRRRSPSPPRRATPAACAAGLIGLAMLAASAAAAPLAPWAPLDGLDEAVRLRMQHLRRARCLPQQAEVRYPVYPGAVVSGVAWGRVEPDCRLRDGWLSLGAVTLVTRDRLAAVADWYAEHLPGHAQYRGAQGRLFVAAEIADFLWERDYHKYPNVALRRAAGAWQAAGYRTVIELNRPAPPAAATESTDE